jgi:hypothetical protein
MAGKDRVHPCSQEQTSVDLACDQHSLQSLPTSNAALDEQNMEHDGLKTISPAGAPDDFRTWCQRFGMRSEAADGWAVIHKHPVVPMRYYFIS